MLSVCVAVKNRSRVLVEGGHELRLFPNCVRSIAAAVPRDVPCEIVVTDWASDDWPLREWIDQAAAPLTVRVVQADGAFSRGRGLNLAADAARGDVLLFTDADVIVSRELIERGLTHARASKAFFPVLYSFKGPEHQAGWWRHEGYGNCVVTREAFARAGRWPEYRSWGREDVDFFRRVSEIAEVVREEVPGFFHQWHPEDILWKDRYADRDPAAVEEIVQSRVAARELAAIVPAGYALVLVDEARFALDEIDGRRALPFLERGGEYAGPPADDATAIAELERMRANGAAFLAFAWPAFWWLDYYAGLRRYVESHLSPVLENERLKVFAWPDVSGEK